MTKTYKINKHKIQSLLSDCTHKDLWMQVDGLLEALSDKEENMCDGNGGCNMCIPLEEPKQEECNCCGWDDNRYTHEPGCNLREEPKEGETEEGVKVFNKCRRCYHEAYGKEYPYAHTCQPKQEECGACDYEGKHNKKITPSRHTCTTKQSTSLKEEISKLVQYTSDYTYDIKTSDEEADKILKLIQSHLVKEIETLEPDKYMKMHDKRLDGYTFAKQDIIKIINNIN